MKKFLMAGVALAMLSGGALAADLPVRSAPPAPVAAPTFTAAPVFTWSGLYAGVNAGYGWNVGDSADYDPAFGFADDDEGGFIGGAQIGYNYQLGSFVVGLETDIQYANVANRGIDGDDDGFFGTVRARAGYAFDRALVYATGGLAYGNLGNNEFLGRDNDDTNWGWTLGGGVEYAFTNNLTAKVEGLYVNLNTDNTYGRAVYGNGDTEFGVVRAGLNYKFNSF